MSTDPDKQRIPLAGRAELAMLLRCDPRKLVIVRKGKRKKPPAANRAGERV